MTRQHMVGRICALAVATHALLVQAAWAQDEVPAQILGQQVPMTIDPGTMKLAFDDEFRTLAISAWRMAPGSRWIAHTPWSGDFGSANFDDPGPNGPFTSTTQGLVITARQRDDGKWHSGLISSMDKLGPGQTGFAQEFGYFEMKAKLPEGPGVWPAFWLIGTDRILGTPELDVMEYYGGFPTKYHATIHFWGKFHNTYGFGHVVTVPDGIMSSQFNTYGVLVTPVMTVVYFNRKAMWAVPTMAEFYTPVYMLADLALGGGWPIDRLQSPQMMNIQYMRAYQEK